MSPHRPLASFRMLIVAGIAALSVAIAACSSAPVTGRQQLMLVSESQAQEMGSQAYKEALGKSKLSQDPKYLDQVKRVGQRVARAAEKPDYQWEFNVIDEPKTINAWALPGGKVAVYTGLLNLKLSDAELGAVMGHEVAHALAQHSRERMSQALTQQIGLAALGATGKLGPGGMQAVNLALGVGLGLPFSRKQESEADFIGLDVMAKAGLDPRAAISLWQKMSAASDGKNPPEFLSTHPSSEHRIRDIEAALPKFMPVYEANKNKA